jgi:hypothetical protein
MKKLVVAFVLAIGFHSGAMAQQTTAPLSGTTKLEQLITKRGELVVRSYTRVGDAGVDINSPGAVFVEAIKLRPMRGGEEIKGLVLEVVEVSRALGRREKRAFVDYDEIPGLMDALLQGSKIERSLSTLQDVELLYVTKGDLVVWASTNASGKPGGFVRSGGSTQTSALLSLQDLGKLQEVIAAAKAVLDK